MPKPSKEQIAVVNEVVLKHHVEVNNYVVGLVRDARLPGDPRESAQDIVQNVYANLLQYKLPARIEAPIAYLKVSALREFLKYLDRHMKEQVWHAEPEEAVVENVADERAEPPDVLALRALRRAIALLSMDEQRVVTMMAHGMKPREITEATGFSNSAVAKALRTLRKSINDVIHGRVRK